MLMNRWRFHLQGVVQGVGFRPYVYGLAQLFGLAGFVSNNSAGVIIEIEGDAATLAAFQQALISELPPLAHVDAVEQVEINPLGENSFRILESTVESGATTLISPDLCICDDCLRELFDPNDRHYRYPFINCTNCGPRFTIIRALPYDRPNTTMADFALCPTCESEYRNPLDRRFHAQPVACPDCGPQLEFIMGELQLEREDALQAARDALFAGRIVAVKGLGGFHLACDAENEATVSLLRERKGRREKPFALMVYDLAQAEKFVYISEQEAVLLCSRERPIVLLKKREYSPIVDSVAPHNPYLGVMLPYTPLHYLLLHELGMPLVMTSGNLSEEPIITENAVALEKLATVADAFLLHNRPIHVPCDDTVLRVDMPLRRSRGYAPFPVKLPFAVPPILAVGGELKNTFCLAHDKHAFMSQHLGDMENLETLEAFERSFEQMSDIFSIKPQIIACDLHPDYLTTRWAMTYAEQNNLRLIPVQHHHAHIAAVMAEHGVDETVLGISFDGTGYGTDRAIWGGEILKADYRGFERLAHLRYVPLAGGDVSIKKPYRMGLAHLWAAGIAWDEDLPPVQACPPVERAILHQQLERNLNTVLTSSMGRLFDAVASLIGIRHTVTYEAQAAMEMEALAVVYESAYRFNTVDSLIDPTPVLKGIIDDMRTGTHQAIIAGRFHRAVVNLIVDMAHRYSLETIALSGGVFQNIQLSQITKTALEQRGYLVLVHQRVPANDGGLALGQLCIAAM
jgi:hydrogenase maturation protein HypF